MQKPKKIVVKLADFGGRANTVHWHSVRTEFETLSSPHQAAPYMPEWFSWGLLFFIFSIIFNTFIKKGKNEYIFKENPKKKVGALLKICNLRYYRSFLTEKWLCNNQKCKKKSLFLSHKLTCFQLEMPQKINISSKKTQKNKNGDALKIYNLRYYRAFLTEKWLYYNQKCKNCQKYWKN